MISSSIHHYLILGITVTSLFKCRAGGTHKNCSLIAELVKETESAFLHVKHIGEGCNGIYFEYVIHPCGNKRNTLGEIESTEQEKIRLCPDWKGCTTVTVKKGNFSSNFEEDNGFVKPEIKDVDAVFKVDIQRLHVTIFADDRANFARLDGCRGMSTEKNCSCPKKLFPVYGNRTGMDWTFDLDGRDFRSDCEYGIKGAIYDHCNRSVRLPKTRFIVPYFSNKSVSAGGNFMVLLALILVTVLVIILVALFICHMHQRPCTAPAATVDAADKGPGTSNNLLLLYAPDIRNQAQQLLRDLEKDLKTLLIAGDSKCISWTKKDRMNGFPARAGISSRWQVHDLHDITDEAKISDPNLWLYNWLSLDNCKVIILTSAQAKATEVYIKGSLSLETQETTHFEQLKAAHGPELLSSMDPGSPMGLTSKNMDMFTLKAVDKIVDGSSFEPTETTAIVVDGSGKEHLDNHMGDIMEESMGREMHLVRPTGYFFEDALHFIMKHNIGFNFSKCFQVRVTDRDSEHTLQYVTPSRVFTWPDQLSDLLQAIQE